MSSIKISELQPVGFNLFSDSESYLNQLSEQELQVQGGIITTVVVVTVTITVTIPNC